MTYNGECAIAGCKREATTAVPQSGTRMPMWLCRRDARIARVALHVAALAAAGDQTGEPQ